MWVCEPECPAEAILPDSDDNAAKWTKLNEEFSEKWPNIVKKEILLLMEINLKKKKTNLINISQKNPERVR